jgi:hypothetical protein
MSEKQIKHAFVSGVITRINGELYTRTLSNEEKEALKSNSVPLSKEKETLINNAIMEEIKENFPALYEKFMKSPFKIS